MAAVCGRPNALVAPDPMLREFFWKTGFALSGDEITPIFVQEWSAIYILPSGPRFTCPPPPEAPQPGKPEPVCRLILEL
jgi:hypothetical protein